MKKNIKARLKAWYIKPIKLSWFCKHKFNPMCILEDISAVEAMHKYWHINDFGVWWKVIKVEGTNFTFKVESPGYTGDKWDGLFSVHYKYEKRD